MNLPRLRFGAWALLPLLACTSAVESEPDFAPEVDELTAFKATAIGNQNIGNCWAKNSHGAYSVPNRRPNGAIDVSQAYFAGRQPLCERKADDIKDVGQAHRDPLDAGGDDPRERRSRLVLPSRACC